MLDSAETLFLELCMCISHTVTSDGMLSQNMVAVEDDSLYYMHRDARGCIKTCVHSV